MVEIRRVYGIAFSAIIFDFQTFEILLNLVKGTSWDIMLTLDSGINVGVRLLIFEKF